MGLMRKDRHKSKKQTPSEFTISGQIGVLSLKNQMPTDSQLNLTVERILFKWLNIYRWQGRNPDLECNASPLCGNSPVASSLPSFHTTQVSRSHRSPTCFYQPRSSSPAGLECAVSTSYWPNCAPKLWSHSEINSLGAEAVSLGSCLGRGNHITSLNHSTAIIQQQTVDSSFDIRDSPFEHL